MLSGRLMSVREVQFWKAQRPTSTSWLGFSSVFSILTSVRFELLLKAFWAM